MPGTCPPLHNIDHATLQRMSGTGNDWRDCIQREIGLKKRWAMVLRIA